MLNRDAERLGVETGDLVRVETEIGWFVDKVWVTEGIKPGILAMSHHLGRWSLAQNSGGNPGTTALAEPSQKGDEHHLKLTSGPCAGSLGEGRQEVQRDLITPVRRR